MTTTKTTTSKETRDAEGSTTTTTTTSTTKWSTIQLAIRLGSVLVLTIAVIGILCLSGKEISIEQILLVIAAGAALAGLSVTRPGGTGGTTAAGGLMLLVLVSLLGGCACFQAAFALAHVDQSDSPEDVMAEVMPLILECSEQAAEVLGRCEAIAQGDAGLEPLIPAVTAPVEVP